MSVGNGTLHLVKPSEKLRVATVSLLPVQFALISASHKPSEVFSWHSIFQASGPFMQNTMTSLMLRNLNSGRGVPSQTVFLIWDPQFALVYVVIQWALSGDGGTALVKASMSDL